MHSNHRASVPPADQRVRAADALVREGRTAMLKALEDMMAEGDAAHRAQPWDITMPAALGHGPLPQPFDEPMDGVSIREVKEPAVFRRFFGR
jgi:hypothetical protein